MSSGSLWKGNSCLHLLCIALSIVKILSEPFFFGIGLFFIQIPDSSLKKVSLATQLFKMSKKYLLLADAVSCNYVTVMAEPSHTATETTPNLNNSAELLGMSKLFVLLPYGNSASAFSEMAGLVGGGGSRRCSQ